ncbi:MAG: AMP-binding protein [Panacagrimonas sp.]
MTLAREELPLACFYRRERERPDAIAFTQPMGKGVVRDLTVRQVSDEARRMAAHLRSFGWEPGTRIAILSKNCAHWIMSDLAIFMAGYVSVPLYPTLTAESVRQVLEHSSAKALFIGKLDGWPAMRLGVPDSVQRIRLPLSPPENCPGWDELIAATPPLTGEPDRDGDELATIMYTSGTTGMPKGVMHSFHNFAWAARTAGKRFGGLSPADRLLSYLPLSHIAERQTVEMLGSLIVGVRIYFAESLDTFAQDLRRARPTFFFSVPRLWVKFQQGVFSKMPRAKLDRLLRVPLLKRVVKRKILAGLGLDQCRVAAGGAAPMPPDLLNWYARLGLEILEVYGMTENCGVSHSSVPGDIRPGYVGQPYEGVKSRLASDGEVQVLSPATMLGYYREPEKAREAMTADGWLRTGDLGRMDEQGRLKITGRLKELFKTSKGKYVAPAPIENRLGSHTSVEACCVMGANLAQPFAVLILSADEISACQEASRREALTASLGQHLEAVNAQLDPHEQLDFLALTADTWTVDNGFVTPTLKVKRNVVEPHYEPRVARWSALRRPVVWDA